MGLADLNPGYSLSRMVAVAAGLFIPLGAASAWGMLRLARVSEKREAIEVPVHEGQQ